MLVHRRFAPAVALTLALVGGAGAALAGPKDVQHCISPTGVDLNEFWGVSEAIVADFCTEIGLGEPWRVTQLWVVAPSYGPAPGSFEPAFPGATPAQDLLAKFVQVRHVVDPGSKHAKTYIFTGSDGLSTRTVDDRVAINAITTGVLQPVSVKPPAGQAAHVVETYWTLTAMHCDGIAASKARNCLPAGEFLVSRIFFTVEPLP